MKKRTLPSKPTIEAMQYMACSLRNKFKVFATVQFFAYGHADTDDSSDFWISINGGYGQFTKTWEQTKYTFEGLMTGAISNE